MAQIAEMTGASGELIYLPYKYVGLSGTRLNEKTRYQATGDSATALAITRNRYKSELDKLGLSDHADMIKEKHPNSNLSRVVGIDFVCLP